MYLIFAPFDEIYFPPDYGKMHGKDALTSESADTLLRRGLKKSEGGEGFIFTRDLKNHLKGLYGLTFEIWSKFAQKIQCPHLIIKAGTQPEYFQAGIFNIRYKR